MDATTVSAETLPTGFDDFGEHPFFCLFYKETVERLQPVLSFLRDGIIRNEKVVCLGDPGRNDTLRSDLSRLGLPVERLEETGCLAFFEAASLCAGEPGPRPDRIEDRIAGLRSTFMERGFPAVRVFMEMACDLPAGEGGRLGECLVALDRLTRAGNLSLLLAFNSREIPGPMILEVLRLFPAIVHEQQVFRNSYYHPLSGFSAGTSPPGIFRRFLSRCRRPGRLRRGKKHPWPYRRGQVLEALFSAAPVGLWLLDNEHGMVFANRNFCDATGVSAEQYLSVRHYSEVMKPEEAVNCMLSDARAFHAGGPVASEQEFTRDDGSRHTYQVVKTRLLDEENRISGLLGLALDITERKNAERLLRHSEARFRDIALSMADFIWETDEEGIFRYCSDKVQEMLGYAAEEMVGQEYSDFFSEEAAGTLARSFCPEGEQGGLTRNLEHWVVDKGGRRRCLRSSGVPVFDDNGSVLGFRGVTEDITGRKEAEASLKNALADAQDSRDKIDNILKSIADGLIVTDTRNSTVLINDAATALLDSGAADSIGAPIGALVQDPSLASQVEAIYDHERGQMLQTALRISSPRNGEERFLQAKTSLMHNKHGRVTGAITVLRDITRQRELDRLKAEFMSMVAHELRTPLTSILGYLEFCLNPDDFGGFSAEQQREFLEEINGKAELLGRLVSDLLDISRVESGQPLPLDIRPFSIERMIGRAVERFKLQAPRHRFVVKLENGPAEQVLADEDKLVQVLENLMSNAVKYSPEGNLVEVAGGVQGACYQVVVKDEGIGMTPEQVARVFDKFYRADFSNTAVRGLGLGMSIARQIVERHGGDIRVESEVGRGTRVTFTVPMKGEKAEGILQG
jgi:PAS domain S-box-containing protein